MREPSVTTTTSTSDLDVEKRAIVTNRERDREREGGERGRSVSGQTKTWRRTRKHFPPPQPPLPWPVLHNGVHVAAVVCSEVHTPGPPEEERRLLTCVSDGRGVDDGCHLLNLLRHEAVEERLVTILERAHEVVLCSDIFFLSSSDSLLRRVASLVERLINTLNLKGKRGGR